MVPVRWNLNVTKDERVRSATLTLPGMTMKVVPHPKDGYFTVDFEVVNIPLVVRRGSFVKHPTVNHTFWVVYRQQLKFVFDDVRGLVVGSDEITQKCVDVLDKIVSTKGYSAINQISFFTLSIEEAFTDKFVWADERELKWEVDGVDVVVGRRRGMLISGGRFISGGKSFRLSARVVDFVGGLDDQVLMTISYNIPLMLKIKFPTTLEWVDVCSRWVKIVSDVYRKVQSGELFPSDHRDFASFAGILSDEDVGVFKRWFSEGFRRWLENCVRREEFLHETGLVELLDERYPRDVVWRRWWGLVERWVSGVRVSVVGGEVAEVTNFDIGGSFYETKSFTVKCKFPYRYYEDLVLPLIERRDVVGLMTAIMFLFGTGETSDFIVDSDKRSIILTLMNLYVTGGV